MSTTDLSNLRKTFVPRGPFNVTPYFARSAKGAIITDTEGRELIDFAGGIGVMNVGHSHPRVIAAIKEQVDKFTHTCFHIVMYEPYVKLAEQLCRLAPGNFQKMAMFANSGAEGVENAIKIARYAKNRPAVICFDHNFHGRTLMGMSLTSKVKPYKFGFGPFAPEIYRAPYAYCYRCPLNLTHPACETACAEYLKEMLVSRVAAEHVAAVIVEPVAGEGGFICPPPDYFPKVAEICRENGIVFIADEVQTGMGRTGKWFAIEHWNVEPDIVISAKSLAAGMPLSAVIGGKELMDAPHVGGLGGTYGGNPLSCAAALEVLRIIEEEDLLSRADVIGLKVKSFFEELRTEYEIIGDVRGLGAMIAMELVKDRVKKTPAPEETKKLAAYCHEKGLLLLSCGNYGNVIRTLMPLVITDRQLEKGLSIIADAFADLLK